jgi:hypothetical protein
MSRIARKFIRFGTGSTDVNAQPIPATNTATNYTPVQVSTEGTDKVSAHLNGINTSLGLKQNLARTIVSVSGNVTLTNYAIHLVDTSAARSLTLPTPSSGAIIMIKDISNNASVNNITIVRAGSEQIEGVSASYTFDISFQSLTLVSNGTNWFII